MATVTTPIETEPEGLYEIVDGQVVEKEVGSLESRVASLLAKALFRFENIDELGEIAIENLFVIQEDPRLLRRPDLAFVTFDRWPKNQKMSPTWAWPMIPDLAVEVISPSDSMRETQRKVQEYLQAGVRLVWQIVPGESDMNHVAYVYQPPMKVHVVRVNEDLDGGHVIPGFRVRLGSLFPPIETVVQ